MQLVYENEANGLRIFETEDRRSIEEVRAEHQEVSLPLPWVDLPASTMALIQDAARDFLMSVLRDKGAEQFGDFTISVEPGAEPSKAIILQSAYWPRPHFAGELSPEQVANLTVNPSPGQVIAFHGSVVERAGFGGASAYETIAAEIGESLHAKHQIEHAHIDRQSRDNCQVGLCDPATIVNDEEQPSYTPPRMTRLDMEGGRPAPRIVKDSPQA
jgi:hypothetical protein